MLIKHGILGMPSLLHLYQRKIQQVSSLILIPRSLKTEQKLRLFFNLFFSN